MNKDSEKLKKIKELCELYNIKISTAESCTGGFISKILTDQSGSSSFFIGSIIAYSNQVKADILNVSPDIIREFGAVSKEVSTLMADGLFKLIECDIAVSTTGIMESIKDITEKKPQVYITIKSKKTIMSKHIYLGNDRHENRINTVNHALDCLYDFINNHYLVS